MSGDERNHALSIAVMAGGRSRRMGRDKAMLPLEEGTMLEHIARESLATGLPVLVVGRPKPPSWSVEPVKFIDDDEPALGPMGGILTALRHAGQPVLVIACDMPLLEASTLRWLINEAQLRTFVDGLIVVGKQGIEPMFSVYAPHCIELFEERIAEGDLSLRHAIAHGSFIESPAPEHVVGKLRNVNTPEEYAMVRR